MSHEPTKTTVQEDEQCLQHLIAVTSRFDAFVPLLALKSARLTFSGMGVFSQVHVNSKRSKKA